MKRYIKPLLISYSVDDISDIIGPIQLASVQFEVWHTAHLQHRYKNEYVIAKLEKPPEIKVEKIDYIA